MSERHMETTRIGIANEPQVMLVLVIADFVLMGVVGSIG